LLQLHELLFAIVLHYTEDNPVISAVLKQVVTEGDHQLEPLLYSPSCKQCSYLAQWYLGWCELLRSVFYWLVCH